MSKEIGSNMWDYSTDIPYTDDFKPWFKKDGLNTTYFKSGRNAIKAICLVEKDSPKRALLPAYTCSTVVNPFFDEKWDIAYYDICDDLSVDLNDLMEKVETFKPSLILFHAYFGMDTLSNIKSVISELRKKEITIVEDQTQSYISAFPTIDADYFVFSLRKFFAIPDGGVLQTSEKLKGVHKEKADRLITEIALKAFEKKKQYIFEEPNASKEEFRELYTQLQTMINENSILRDISRLSLDILRNADIPGIMSARRRNYSSLHKYGVDPLKSVFGEIDIKSVPLYYPTYAKDSAQRSLIQHSLAQKNIYCPIIWPKPEKIDIKCVKAQKIYERILCIPIDQRYDESDMKTIARALQEEII